MRLPRIPIWLPLAGLLLSFAGLSVDTYFQLAKALQDDAISRKTPDSLLMKKVFTSPVPADVGDRYVRNRIIRDAISGAHRNTLVLVYERKEDDRALIAENRKDIVGRVPQEVADYVLKVVRGWDADGETYRLAEGFQFQFGENHYHLIGRRFPMDRGEVSDSGELLLITNLDTTIARPRDIFIAAKLKTASVVMVWGIVAIVINVVPIVRLTKRLNQGQSLEVWWWVPQQIADLAEQLELDREANLRFRAEANAFRASIDLKSRMIDMSPVPTMICKLPKNGKQAIVTFANKAVADQFGYENIVGEPLNLLVPPEFGGYHTWGSLYDEELGREIGMAVCPHAGKSRVLGQQRPVPVIAKNGIRLEAMLSVDRIADDEDGSRNYIGTLQDITPLVRARREAEEYSEIARGTINNISDAIVFLKDSDGVYQLCNTAFIAIAGRDPIGLKDEDLAWTDEETAKYRAEDTGVLTTGEPFSTLEQIGGEPTSHWYLTRKVLVSILGKPSVLGVSLDVDELIRAKEEAESRRETMTVELQGFNHDVKNAIGGVLKMHQSLKASLEKRGALSDFNDRELLYLERIHVSATRLFRLNEGMREIRKLEQRTLKNVTPWEIFDSVRQDFTNTDIAWQRQESFKVCCDADKVAVNVISNLIQNAKIYCGANPSIQVRAAIDGKFGVFAVTDNGPGIPQGKEEVIFNLGAGSRLNQTIEGTGMGLYQARKTVESFGGKIWVKNNPDKPGCTFFFSIPIAIANHG